MRQYDTEFRIDLTTRRILKYDNACRSPECTTFTGNNAGPIHIVPCIYMQSSTQPRLWAIGVFVCSALHPDLVSILSQFASSGGDSAAAVTQTHTVVLPVVTVRTKINVFGFCNSLSWSTTNALETLSSMMLDNTMCVGDRAIHTVIMPDLDVSNTQACIDSFVDLVERHSSTTNFRGAFSTDHNGNPCLVDTNRFSLRLHPALPLNPVRVFHTSGSAVLAVSVKWAWEPVAHNAETVSRLKVVMTSASKSGLLPASWRVAGAVSGSTNLSAPLLTSLCFEVLVPRSRAARPVGGQFPVLVLDTSPPRLLPTAANATPEAASCRVGIIPTTANYMLQVVGITRLEDVARCLHANNGVVVVPAWPALMATTMRSFEAAVTWHTLHVPTLGQCNTVAAAAFRAVDPTVHSAVASPSPHQITWLVHLNRIVLPSRIMDTQHSQLRTAVYPRATTAEGAEAGAVPCDIQSLMDGAHIVGLTYAMPVSRWMADSGRRLSTRDPLLFMKPETALRTANKRVVVLRAAAGSGKTCTMLRLAESMVTRDPAVVVRFITHPSLVDEVRAAAVVAGNERLQITAFDTPSDVLKDMEAPDVVFCDNAHQLFKSSHPGGTIARFSRRWSGIQCADVVVFAMPAPGAVSIHTMTSIAHTRLWAPYGHTVPENGLMPTLLGEPIMPPDTAPPPSYEIASGVWMINIDSSATVGDIVHGLPPVTWRTGAFLPMAPNMAEAVFTARDNGDGVFLLRSLQLLNNAINLRQVAAAPLAPDQIPASQRRAVSTAMHNFVLLLRRHRDHQMQQSLRITDRPTTEVGQAIEQRMTVAVQMHTKDGDDDIHGDIVASLREIVGVHGAAADDLARLLMQTAVQCCLCFEEMGGADTENRVAMLPCGHMFHTGCIQNIRQQPYRCPLCRKVFEMGDALALDPDRLRNPNKRPRSPSSSPIDAPVDAPVVVAPGPTAAQVVLDELRAVRAAGQGCTLVMVGGLSHNVVGPAFRARTDVAFITDIAQMVVHGTEGRVCIGFPPAPVDSTDRDKRHVFIVPLNAQTGPNMQTICDGIVVVGNNASQLAHPQRDNLERWIRRVGQPSRVLCASYIRPWEQYT